MTSTTSAMASLLSSIAPRTDCSAMRSWGGVRSMLGPLCGGPSKLTSGRNSATLTKLLDRTGLQDELHLCHGAHIRRPPTFPGRSLHVEPPCGGDCGKTREQRPDRRAKPVDSRVN